MAMACIIWALEDACADIPFDVDPDDTERIAELKTSAAAFLNHETTALGTMLGVLGYEGVEQRGDADGMAERFLTDDSLLNGYKRRRRKAPQRGSGENSKI